MRSRGSKMVARPGPVWLELVLHAGGSVSSLGRASLSGSTVGEEEPSYSPLEGVDERGRAAKVKRRSKNLRPYHLELVIRYIRHDLHRRPFWIITYDVP